MPNLISRFWDSELQFVPLYVVVMTFAALAAFHHVTPASDDRVIARHQPSKDTRENIGCLVSCFVASRDTSPRERRANAGNTVAMKNSGFVKRMYIRALSSERMLAFAPPHATNLSPDVGDAYALNIRGGYHAATTAFHGRV